MSPRRARPTQPLRLAALMLSALLLGACSPPQSELERVKAEGRLVVITRNAATTYFEGPFGPMGMEYDLVKGFADSLGVELELLTAANVGEVLSRLAEGEGDFAAAGLTITEPRKMWVRFTPPYQMIRPQLVYRLGSERPSTLDGLKGHLEVIANSSHADTLEQLRYLHRNLDWVENGQAESEELLTQVSERFIDYTVADSNEVAMSRRFYPELRIAFDIGEPQPLAWAFPKFRDESLYQAAADYIAGLEKGGHLANYIDRYYGHLEEFDYVGTLTFLRHIEERLPDYRPLFEYAGKEYGMDWRLLAAISYQESHWNPKAVSPTGVRGIMMLTELTAAHLGVAQREDPVESIRGGALYMTRLLGKIPERVTDPDRTWLAIAAYNIGHGHLEDARIITQKRGGNPDHWKDVRENLPLLRNSRWYKNTQHGYARGNEAVRYVENIRSYYDILNWYVARAPQATPVDSEGDKALQIINPAL